MKIWFNRRYQLLQYLHGRLKALPVLSSQHQICQLNVLAFLQTQCKVETILGRKIVRPAIKEMVDVVVELWFVPLPMLHNVRWFSPEHMQNSKSMTIPHSPTSTQLQ
jgi:hypothetical protein